MVSVAVARCHDVDEPEPRGLDDTAGHPHVRGRRSFVLLGQRVREIRVEKQIAVVVLDEEAALAEPPEMERACGCFLDVTQEDVVRLGRLDQTPTSSRTIATPRTRFASFSRAAQRAVWLSPQSGANDSRSGGAYCRKWRARRATSSEGSIQ
jgi:hypothetical protein